MGRPGRGLTGGLGAGKVGGWTGSARRAGRRDRCGGGQVRRGHRQAAGRPARAAARDSGHDEALAGHHSVAEVRQRVRLHRAVGRGADRELVERARDELVDPGQGLLAGQLVGDAAVGDRAPDGAAQEHDHAVLHRHHDAERGDVLRHVPDHPGGQPGRDHGGGQLGVGRDGGRPARGARPRPGRGRRLPRRRAAGVAPAVPGVPRGIRTTVSPNRPTRPAPGSIPICGVIRSIALSLSEAAAARSAPCRPHRPIPEVPI